MGGVVARARSLLVAAGASLAIVGAAVAPAAGPSQAQVLDPFGPEPGPPFPGPLPLPFPAPLPALGPGPGPSVSPTQARAAAVNQGALQALNRGDVSGAIVLFTEDATYWFSDGVGLCSAAPCVGREAIRRELERQVSHHARFVPLGGESTGTHSIGLWDIRSDRVQQAGAQRILGVIVAEVRGDRIASLRITLVRDDPQTQTFLNWLQTQPATTAPAPTPAAPPAAPTPAPAPAGAPPPAPTPQPTAPFAEPPAAGS